MQTEVGIVTAHPIAQMYKSVLQVWRTWRFCRANGYACTKWYGVYQAGSEIALANCGPLPGALDRARAICELMESRRGGEFMHGRLAALEEMHALIDKAGDEAPLAERARIRDLQQACTRLMLKTP